MIDADMSSVLIDIEYGMNVHVPPGLEIDFINPITGLTLLQRAVGLDHLKAARALLAHGAKLTPDPFGRMPSLIAIECHASDEMVELVSAAEEAAGV